MVSQAPTDLQISVEETAAWSRKLVVTVPAERVRSERAKVTRQLSKRVRLPGFRKGRVPAQRIEARYGPDIDRQTRQQVIEDAFRRAIEVKELEPISEPRIANISYDRDSELTFEVAFDIRPEITLNRTGGFRLRRAKAEVAEEEIDEELEALRKRQGLWIAVDRKAQAGDSVKVAITPLEAGSDGSGGPEEYTLVIGEGQAIPDVESAIMELEPGDESEFEVEFPDDFPDESQRGVRQKLRIEVKQVQEQELPALDDEFARSLGDFEDLAALRKAISDERLRLKDREIEGQLGEELVGQIIEANPFDVPDSMVDRYVAALIGPPPEGADPDVVARAKEQARPAAEWGIKRSLILRRIVEQQDLQASEGEVRERVERLASAAGRPAREVRARLAKSGELREIERRITEEKALDYLMGQSEIVLDES